MFSDSIETPTGIGTPARETPTGVPLDMDLELLQSISTAVSEARNVETVLKTIVTGLVEKAGFSLARIWLIRPADIGSTCPSSAECPDHSTCLHLAASAGHAQVNPGDWSSLTSAFPRFPVRLDRRNRRIGAGR